jgi:hypothetical protein
MSRPEVLELEKKATRREVALCHCKEVALTDCRCWG